MQDFVLINKDRNLWILKRTEGDVDYKFKIVKRLSGI